MALVLVLIAGALLAAVARRSLAGAVETQTAVEELQRRWAITSMRATFSGGIEALLDRAERGEANRDEVTGQARYANPPMPELRIRCRLADIDYELALTDEQAKANLNTFLTPTSVAEARSAAAALTAGKHGATQLRLRPLPRQSDASMPRLAGYHQVFDQVDARQLLGGRAGEGLASPFTLWGDGKVNIRRVSSTGLRRACKQELGGSVVEGLIRARAEDPYAPLDAMLNQIEGLSPEMRAKLSNHVTDQSLCHGLWIIAHGKQRRWYTLLITAKHQASRDLYEFAW